MPSLHKLPAIKKSEVATLEVPPKQVASGGPTKPLIKIPIKMPILEPLPVKVPIKTNIQKPPDLSQPNFPPKVVKKNLPTPPKELPPIPPQLQSLDLSTIASMLSPKAAVVSPRAPVSSPRATSPQEDKKQIGERGEIVQGETIDSNNTKHKGHPKLTKEKKFSTLPRNYRLKTQATKGEVITKSTTSSGEIKTKHVSRNSEFRKSKSLKNFRLSRIKEVVTSSHGSSPRAFKSKKKGANTKEQTTTIREDFSDEDERSSL